MRNLILCLLAVLLITSFAGAAHAKSLVLVFSRADENYNVGYVEKGNTRILAEMAADITKGDLFEIKTVKSYPKEYRPATEVAKQEKENNARPEINGPLPDMSKYDVIFLGYPIWWGDLPMAVYTFLEQYDWTGKKIALFVTHEGSGLSSIPASIKKTTQAEAVSGFSLYGHEAQNERESSQLKVNAWLKKLGF